MKIKLDYVTNSSSTSYICQGVALSLSDFSEALTGKPCEKGWTPDYDGCDITELLEELGITSVNNYDDEWIVGLDPGEMGEDETKRQFNQRIADLLNEKLGLNLDGSKIGLFYGEVYDG
jgi:hypothetical protein